jgi:hypothetical protein
MKSLLGFETRHGSWHDQERVCLRSQRLRRTHVGVGQAPFDLHVGRLQRCQPRRPVRNVAVPSGADAAVRCNLDPRFVRTFGQIPNGPLARRWAGGQFEYDSRSPIFNVVEVKFVGVVSAQRPRRRDQKGSALTRR